MPLPYTFAAVTELDTPQLDANFNALGALTVIPCTCAGTNTLTLTPAANTPLVSAYTNFAPIFAFIAANTNTTAVTANIAGIGAVNVYKANGSVAVVSGDIVAGNLYYLGYNAALNSGNGGLVILNPSFVSTASQFIIGATVGTLTAATTYYLGVNGAQSGFIATLAMVAINGFVRNVTVRVNNAPGAGQNFAYTLIKNGTPTAITGTISGASSFAFTNTTPLAVVQTDWLVIEVITSASATATNHFYSIEVDPT